VPFKQILVSVDEDKNKIIEKMTKIEEDIKLVSR
jgi:hypothetical protein